MGYPDWWDDLQKRKAATKAPAHRTGGKANLASGDHPGEITSSYSGMDLNKREASIVEQGTSKQKEERDEIENHTEKGRRERVTQNPTQTPLYTKTPPTLSKILAQLLPKSHPAQIITQPLNLASKATSTPSGSLIVVIRTL